MSRSVLVEMDLPKDWRTFRLSPALNVRLQELLDRQDQEGQLAWRERREALALTEQVDLLSLMRLRYRVAAKRAHAFRSHCRCMNAVAFRSAKERPFSEKKATSALVTPTLLITDH